jgi:hypothetical protein
MVVRVASTILRGIKALCLVRPDRSNGCSRTNVNLDAVHEDYSRLPDVTKPCRRWRYRWSFGHRQSEETNP